MDKIKKDSFILMSYIDKNLCEDIIQYYKDFEHRATSGKVFYMNETNLVVGVDASIKDSLDLHLDGNRDLYLKFHKEIGNVLKRIAVGNGESDHDVQMTVTKRANPTFTISSQGGVTNNVATNFSNNCVGVNGSGGAYSNYSYNWVAEAEL